jgi:transposase
MRYGLMSNFRRSWSEVGLRASLDQKQAFLNSYLYTAINPISGESFHLLGFSDMNTITEFTFLTELKKQHPNQQVVLVVDNAPCHRAKIIKEIPGLRIVYLPSYSPELNPVERFFEEIRRDTCNVIFETLDKLEETITKAVNSWTENRLKKLCGYRWILEQVGEVS